jgi:hypothetical protein
MKVTVNRQLRGGAFFVSFTVSDFTPAELEKMQSFGVPGISILYRGAAGGRLSASVGINQINEKIVAEFATEDEARKYEEAVLHQMREVMKRLREVRDDFTSAQEVDI